jgi:putative transposase
MGSCIRRVNKLRYKVKSQSDAWKWYEVVKQYGHNIGGRQEGEWTCECPDFEHRRIVCKHVYAVAFSKELRRRIVSQDVMPTITAPAIPESNVCDRCKSENSIVKDGLRHNKSGDVQTYRCKSCHHKYIINTGFEKYRATPKVVTAALDLYFKGVSLRKICDHLRQFYSVKMTHASVIKWLRKFVDVVKPYVDSLSPPRLSGVYHVDEMMIHAKRERMEVGHYQWLWNLMDDTTRFWISSMVSQRREAKDAQRVFSDAKKKTNHTKAIIHDGLRTYDEAFQKEYFSLKNPRVQNIRSVSVRHEGLNSKVERLHGTIREREKIMRGMQTRETAQKVVDAMRINYNFVREHSTIKKTPAEKAGIKLQLGENKIENLIRLAANKKCNQ